jgi:hypothetical protein
METNVGSADRALRVMAGLIVIFIGIDLKSWWGIVGLVPLATAVIGWCPVYLPFGISTCKTKKE